MNPSTASLRLGLNELMLPKEKSYFNLLLIFSILVWIGLAISIVGLIYGLIFGVFAWIGNGLLTAYLRAEAVAANEHQLPRLHATFLETCQKLGVSKIPRLYVLQAGGTLNAFATKFAGRDFVVVYSDMLEALGPDSDEIKFVLGHELGHIKSAHIVKRLFLLPGIFLPLLGSAYLRACEASCDRHGAYAANTLGGALRAMMTLSGGRGHGPTLDADAFAQQHFEERGFFVSWHELTSGYPTLSQRVSNLLALSAPNPARVANRHPLAYLFALVTPGGQLSAAPNMLIFVVVIGLLAAMAIPAFAKVRDNSVNLTCQNNQRQIASAFEQAALELGKTPANYGDFIGPGKPLNAMPVCPAQGNYSVNIDASGDPIVSCSAHPHNSRTRGR